ncbi:hypothetical protein GOP47_0003046 [Adiantum capillus-veneris]|uniref:Uncharacterized protein n=1 Tax=Adiantum capillus-veneris TaxID=13818 RepID=A0A9D4ZPR1_ADICA|nr:hypothetical protein GOP47_0003046 [Adiantum capillus-veneris]
MRDGGREAMLVTNLEAALRDSNSKNQNNSNRLSERAFQDSACCKCPWEILQLEDTSPYVHQLDAVKGTDRTISVFLKVIHHQQY